MKNNKFIPFGFFVFLISLIILSSFVVADPSITYNNPTPSNGSTVSSRNFIINASIDSVNPIDSLVYSNNYTNYTALNSFLIFAVNFDNRSSLNENSTNVYDFRRNKNYTIYGGTNISLTQNGKYNGAINFTGLNAFVNTSFNTIGMNTFTVCSWATWSKLGSNDILVSAYPGSNRGFWLNKGATNHIGFTVGNTSTATTSEGSAVVTVGEWYFACGTYNGSRIISYVNAVNTSESNLISYTNSSFNVTIGSHPTLSAFHNGTIDEVMIFNRSLSIDEIGFLYNSSYSKFNNTRYLFSTNQSGIVISNKNFDLFVNDTSNNINQSSLSLRFLSTINLTTNSLGTTHPMFYGINTHGIWGSNISYINPSGDQVTWIPSNYTFHQNLQRDTRIAIVRFDANFEFVSYNATNFTNNFNTTNPNYNSPEARRNLITLYNTLGIKVYLIADYMPSWLQNRTSGYCNSTKWTSCTPTSYDTFGQLTKNYITYLTSNGLYNNTIYAVEVWNEPYGSNWLNNISTDNVTKALEYVKLFNATYTVVKQTYPDIQVGGPAGYRDYPIMTNTFVSNVSNFDFVSDHPYSFNYLSLNSMINDTNNLNTLCNNNGKTCIFSHSEYSITQEVYKNTSSYSTQYALQYAYTYSQMLNNYANRSMMMPYQWSEAYKYSNTTVYPEYPQKYALVSESSLDNEISSPLGIIYNFSRYANGIIYNTTIDSNEFTVVYSESSGKKSITIINKENIQQNITINCLGFTGNLIDTQTGILYSCASGTSDKALYQDAYGVSYLTEPVIDVVNGEYVYYNYLGEELFVGGNASLIINYTYSTFGGNAAGDMANSFGSNAMWISILIMVIFASVILSFFNKIEPTLNKENYY